jgi:hypothetical protein
MGVLNATDETRALLVVKTVDTATATETVSTRFLNGRLFAATESPDDVVNTVPRIREKFFVLKNKLNPYQRYSFTWTRPGEELLRYWDVVAEFRIDIPEGEGL